MIDGTFVRSGRGIAAAVLAGLVGGCLVTAPPAVAEVHLEQYVEVSQCTPATGQECPQAADVEFTVGPNESVQAHFTGASGGCSDVLIRFLGDGRRATGSGSARTRRSPAGHSSPVVGPTC